MTAVIVGTFIFIAIWIGSSAAINNYVQKDLTDEMMRHIIKMEIKQMRNN